MKISKKTIMKLKKDLIELVIATLGYAWITFTYGSFVLLIISGYESLGFFLIGQFSFILAVIGSKAYKNWKEKIAMIGMDRAESERLEKKEDILN